MSAHEHNHDYVEVCRRVLKEQGARLTKPRLAVATCLLNSKKPQAPRDIFEKITKSKKLPEVDKVTVYRILEAFLDYGLVHQVGPNGAYVPCTHVSCSSGFHVLTRCSKCGATTESHLPEKLAEGLREHLKKTIKFTPTEHVVQIDGTCSKCS